jgi:hypothetical protein
MRAIIFKRPDTYTAPQEPDKREVRGEKGMEEKLRSKILHSILRIKD